MSPSPRDLGYRMPAEWEPHAATWLSWPHKEESWPGKFEPIPEVFAEIVRHLVPGEEVHINVADRDMEDSVLRLLAERGVPLPRVHCHRIPTNDAWCRDHGPTFVVRDQEGVRDLALINWRYNAWGGKYPPYDLDDRVPLSIAETLALPCFSPGIVMEGGSLDVDGQGALLTTESCLLNPNRNPHLSRAEIENVLRDHLGVSRVLWLGEGIVGDDTDGHVDDLARFVSPRVVVTVVEQDPADDNHAPLEDNLRRLRSMSDAAGRPLEIVTLPMPEPRYQDGQRLPCSYANFYIGNGVVLVPTFGCDSDATALETLGGLFPGRQVVGLFATDLVWGLGAFHCVTQQQPAVDRL